FPPVGWSSPLSIFKVVVLPAPFGPRKPTTSPGSMVNDTASTAVTSRVSRRTRLRTDARRPCSRTGTLNVLDSSSTSITGTAPILPHRVESRRGKLSVEALDLTELEEARCCLDPRRELGTPDP